jgi:hypothetical protein
MNTAYLRVHLNEPLRQPRLSLPTHKQYEIDLKENRWAKFRNLMFRAKEGKRE